MRPLATLYRTRIVHALMITLSSFAFGSPGHAETVRDQLWVANNAVYTVAQWNNTIFLGGTFSLIGPPVGAAATIDATTGAALTPYWGIAGSVYVVTPDGAGGYYVGGNFRGVHGAAQANLAHFDSSGNLTNWNPGVNNTVTSIVVDGSTVYIGGFFTQVGAQGRRYLAAVDAATGTPTGWNPNSGASTGGIVNHFLLSGNTLYVGGNFHNIGGVTRNLIASFDLTTGALTGWNPDGQSTGTSVDALAQIGNTIYVGGAFAQIGGQPRNRLAAIDATSGLATTWNPNVGGTRVQTIVPTQQTVSPFTLTFWLGGDFTSVGGVTRNNIAAVDGSGALSMTFNPGANSRVMSLLVPTDGSGNATAVYAGGNFSVLGGMARSYIGCLSPSGVPTDWDPETDNTVYTLLSGAGTIIAGGVFATAGMTARANLAALDATSGALIPWDPSPNGVVRSLVVQGNTLYVGGNFGTIAANARAGAAAFNLSSFTLTPWDPKLTCGAPSCTGAPDVHAIARPTVGNVVYLGGNFAASNGSSRPYFAAVDTATASLLAFDAIVNGEVDCIVVRQRDVAPFDPLTVYFGGLFNSVRVAPRDGLCEVDAGTGALTTWHPATTSGTSVGALAFQSGYPTTIGTVFVGGFFTSMAGQTTTGLVAIDASTGLAQPWNLSTLSSTEQVMALMVRSGFAYAGGFFTHIGTIAQNNLVRINASTGVVDSWNPVPAGNVDGLGQDGGTIYIAGNFHAVSNYAHTQFAGIGDGSVTAVELGTSTPRATALRGAPNPFHDWTAFRFSLPKREAVSVVVFDVAGRLVRRLYRGVLDPGEQSMTWDGRDDNRRPSYPGVYFARVMAGSRDLTVKISLMR